LKGNKEPLGRARKQPVDKTTILWRLAPDKPIFASIDPLHVKLLAGLSPILLAKLCGKNDLTFAGDSCFHGM
jgi:hypothetical protein